MTEKDKPVSQPATALDPIAPPLPAPSQTEIAHQLGHISRKVEDISKKLDKKPSRSEQILAFSLAVALAAAGAYFTTYFTARDIGRITRTTETAKKEVELYQSAIRLVIDVEHGFEAYIVANGREEKGRKAAAPDEELQKIIESKVLGDATQAVDAFNDYVHLKKAELQKRRGSWKNEEILEMQNRAQTLQDAALKSLSDWFNTRPN